MPRPPCSRFPGPDSRRRSARPAVGRCSPGSQRRSRRPWRGGHRKDRAVAARRRQASGFRIAQIAGVEAEMELPFAGLHQLCAPMFARLDALPAPQRDALSVAFGRSSGGTRTGSLSPSRCSASCPPLPRTSHCSVSWMTRNGWTRPRIRSSDSSRDGCWPSRWQSFSPFESRRTGASSRACRVAARRAGGEGSPCAAGERRSGRTGPARPRPDHRRDPRKSARSGGAARSVSAAELAGGFQLLAAGDLPGHIEDHYLRRVVDCLGRRSS